MLFAGVNLKGKSLFLDNFGNIEFMTISKSSFDPKEFVLFFKDFKNNKRDIYNELRKKAGVYLFKNNITNDLYVGSSINLTKRMVSYCYYVNSGKKSNLVILRTIKKYGAENFSLGILEFCKKDPNVCIELEQK